MHGAICVAVLPGSNDPHLNRQSLLVSVQRTTEICMRYTKEAQATSLQQNHLI